MEEIGVNSRSDEEWSGDWWLSGLVIFVDRRREMVILVLGR